MSPSDIREAYRRYEEGYGSEKPTLSRDELHDEIHAAGLYFDSRSSDEDWESFFERLFEQGF